MRMPIPLGTILHSMKFIGISSGLGPALEASASILPHLGAVLVEVPAHARVAGLVGEEEEGAADGEGERARREAARGI